MKIAEFIAFDIALKTFLQLSTQYNSVEKATIYNICRNYLISFVEPITSEDLLILEQLFSQDVYCNDHVMDMSKVILNEMLVYDEDGMEKNARSKIEQLAVMGKMTQEDMQKAVITGEMRSQKRMMDGMRRGAYRRMDNIGGILIDENDPSTISKAIHKLFPYLNSKNMIKRKAIASFIVKELCRKAANENGSFSTSLSDELRRMFNDRELDTIVNPVSNPLGGSTFIPVSVVAKDAHRILRRKAEKGNKIVGIDRYAKQHNLQELLHEVDESSQSNALYSNNPSSAMASNIVKQITGDSHVSPTVIANESFARNRIGKKYQGTKYDTIGAYRSLQYNSSPRSKEYAATGNLLGLTTNVKPIPKEHSALHNVINNPEVGFKGMYEMPDVSYKKFFRNASKQSRKLDTISKKFLNQSDIFEPIGLWDYIRALFNGNLENLKNKPTDWVRNKFPNNILPSGRLIKPEYSILGLKINNNL